MTLYVVLQATLFLALLARHFVENITLDLAVKFVDIHRANPITEPPVLDLEPLDHFFVLGANGSSVFVQA